MTLLETFAFPFNKDETSIILKFPLLENAGYNFSFTFNNSVYNVRVTFSQFTQSAVVSLYDQNNNPISLNMPLSVRINDTSPNYAHRIGAYLFWEKDKGFTLYEDV